MFPERDKGGCRRRSFGFWDGGGMNAGGGGRRMGGMKRESMDMAGGNYFSGGLEPFDFAKAEKTSVPFATEQGRLTGSYVVETSRPPQEKRRKFGASPSPVGANGKPLLVVRRSEMLANLTHIIAKYVGGLTGTGKGMSLSSLREAFQATFSYPISVESLAGHANLQKFLEDQFSASVRLRSDERGSCWVYPVEPSPLTINSTPDPSVVHRDVKSVQRQAIEEKVRMVARRKLLEAKFYRWRSMRDMLVASGQSLPSLEKILGIRAKEPRETDRHSLEGDDDGFSDFSQDGEIEEETGSSQGGAGQTEERIGVCLSHFVSECGQLFPDVGWDSNSLLPAFENDPKLVVKSDSTGAKCIEERNPSVQDLQALLASRKSIADLLLEPPQMCSKAVFTNDIAVRMRDKIQKSELNEMGFTHLEHFLRNTTMSGILARVQRARRKVEVVLDPLRNVRDFLEGRMSSLMSVDPAGTLPFAVLKQDFEEMFHELHPEALGLGNFESGECPYLKDVCQLIASCSNELFFCPTLLCKFKWMVRKFITSAPIWTGNQESIPEGGVPLLAITESFSRTFRQAASLSDLGYGTWETLLNDFRDICTYVISDDDCIIILFQPSQEMQSPFLEQARNSFLLSRSVTGQQGVAHLNPNSRASSSTPISNPNILPFEGSTPQRTPNLERDVQEANIGSLTRTPPGQICLNKDTPNGCFALEAAHISWDETNDRMEKKLQWVDHPAQFQPNAEREPSLSGTLGQIWMSCWEMLDTLVETPQATSSVETSYPVSSIEMVNSQGEVHVQGFNGGLSGFGVQLL